MIKKVGTEHILYTRDGTRILGRHDTPQQARRQEMAIKVAEARREAFRRGGK